MKIGGKEYHTIWFENNVVKIIDQTKLPHQFIIKELKTVKNKKPAGSFFDPRGGGEYWSCNGNNRTWAAVTAWDACISGGWFGKKSRATYKGKSHNSKPSGSFYDPRRGGQYWSCNGWNRTAYGVTSNRACSKAYPESLKKAQFKFIP